MKNIFLFFLLFPLLSNAQFREVNKEPTGEIGSFYDEIRNAPFSLSKIQNVYKMCFYNSTFVNAETQMSCLNINESETSMNDFYKYVLLFFNEKEMFKDKYLETNQYRITVSKVGNFVSLKFHDKYSNIRNNSSETSLFSVENWKKLFGKS